MSGTTARDRQAARRKAVTGAGGAYKQFALSARSIETIGLLRASLGLTTDVAVIEHLLDEARTRRGL